MMKETFFDKLILRENVTPVRRLVIGGLLAASAAFQSIPIIGAVSVASFIINSTMFHFEKKAQQRKLLVFYQDEIAALVHKSPKSLTVEDLEQVGKPVAEGGFGVKLLGAEMGGLNILQKFKLGNSTISSLITTGILMGICAGRSEFLSGGGITMALGLGLIGFGYTAIAKTVKATSQAIFGSHEVDNSVNQRLIRIAEEIKENPVNPIEIFGLFVDADPMLQSRIQAQFKARYADLPVIQKKQVVEAFEPELRVISLTESINKGEVKPSLVGFIAGGFADDSLPGVKKYASLFEKPVEKIADRSFEMAEDTNLSDHRTRLLAEREMAAANKSLH